MITDKNKYKQGENVRFKSYALSGQKRPLKENLEVWLQTAANYKYKKITTISPYHDGGYAGEILLHDSLELRLDKNYNIQLREKTGRIVANTTFKYEDYELFDSRIETKLNSFNHYNPDTNKIEIKTVDANGLYLQDMKAEIIVMRNKVLNSYTQLLILPDTLMFKKIDLANDKPTITDIPPELFGESNCSYDVFVKAYTYDNQVLSSRNSATFFKSKYDISYSTHDDTICFNYTEQGKNVCAKAEFWYNNSKERKIIELPYKEQFNQSIKQYNIKVTESAYIKTIETQHINSLLNIDGGIVSDSFNVKLINPLNIELSWYIYQGNTLLEKGSGKEFDFKYPNTNLDFTHYVEIFYFMGESEHVYRRTFVPKTEFLNVDIDLPERIYPGQTLNATITVKDNMNKSVKDVDITAFAYNSQLNYNVPDLPYYGATPQSREQRSSYSIDKKKHSSFNTPLDYKYWNKTAYLDTMKYYQYTYPWQKMFIHTINTPDSATQFAPYVMKNGQAIDIYVIEKNGYPIYFSWTNQTKSYSFVASDTAKQKITLRLHDCAIVFDSMSFEKGKKTILSIDIDHLPPNVRIIKLDTRDKYGNYHFTDNEKNSYRKLISKIPVDEHYNFTYLKHENEIYPVFHKCLQKYNSEILAGPVPQGYMQYIDGIKYKHEGGFLYKYEDNVVYKYPIEATPESIRFSSNNNFSNLNDFALTTKLFKKRIDDCRKATAWFPDNIQILQMDKEMNFKLPHPDTTGVSNLLLRDVESKKILFPDNFQYSRREYNYIYPSVYDVILLFNSGNYICYNNLDIKSNTYIELDMRYLELHQKDSLSQKWLALNTPAQSYNIFYSRPLQRNSKNIVKGTVIEKSGEPLAGATISLTGTNYGTIADIDGNFEIIVDDYYNTLTFSYIGYKTKEMQATMGSEITVTLAEERLMLDELVVIAYGVQLRQSFTGAVAGVSTDYLNERTPQMPPEDMADDAEKEKNEAENKLYSELLQLNGLRSNFSDVGFWEPRLYTDNKGKSQFTVTFPDNITQWNTVVYAMNRKLKTGTTRKYIKSYKPLMAELKNPQFLIVGDSSYFAGNIRNYTSDKEMSGNVVFYVDKDTIVNTNLQFTSSHQNKMLVAPLSTDSVIATYVFLRNDGYSDGEKRTIPVYQQGTEIADGTLSFLQNGERKNIMANENEEIHITIAANQLHIYADAANYLSSYKYDCNEQLASKLIGLLNCKLYQHYTGVEFKYDKRINEIIKKLIENCNDKKLWSWWGRSPNTSYWMSAHIIRALNMAKKEGYAINIDLTTIEQDYMDTRTYRSNASLYDIEILNVLSQVGVKQDYAAAINLFDKQIGRLDFIADSIAKATKQQNITSYLKEKLLLLEIRQNQNINYSPDILTKYLKKDVFGGVYFGDEFNRFWYNDNMITTLIAYRIVSKDSTLQHLKMPMQMYILRTKQNGWNTYQASSAVMTILPDLLAESANNNNIATIAITGKENKIVTEFPYTTTLTNGEYLNIEKKNGLPLIYSAYKMKYVTNENESDAFDVYTYFDNTNKNIIAGEKVKLIVTVNVKQENAEHVMIEVPVPAACSYVSKNSYWGYYGNKRNHEVYREYFKDKVAIFCEKLPIGTYHYEIELLPRYTGHYILNPAKAEMMYFPVINANNSLRKVTVEEQMQ
jgi:hypothetical protein